LEAAPPRTFTVPPRTSPIPPARFRDPPLSPPEIETDPPRDLSLLPPEIDTEPPSPSALSPLLIIVALEPVDDNIISLSEIVKDPETELSLLVRMIDVEEDSSLIASPLASTRRLKSDSDFMTIEPVDEIPTPVLLRSVSEEREVEDKLTPPDEVSKMKLPPFVATPVLNEIEPDW